MPPASNQISLDFDHITEKNLKPILKKFEKFGCPVTNVEAPNKSKRESGVLVKSFTLTFEDGQKLFAKIKASGTIFQVKLNNKVVPVRHVDDLEKAVIEMVDYVQGNAKAYARAKMQAAKKKLKPAEPKVYTTRKEKISNARTAEQQLSQNNADLEKELNEAENAMASDQSKLVSAQSDLEAERQKTVTLETEIDELEKAQAV